MERGADPADSPIPLGAMCYAAEITEVLAVHAEKAFTGTDRRNNDALYLLKKLMPIAGANSEVGKQELYQKAKQRFDSVEGFDGALQTLDDNGYIRIRQKKTKGRPLTAIAVNPLISR
jgi:cytolysin (calcineurin-like family phosphatase)